MFPSRYYFDMGAPPGYYFSDALKEVWDAHADRPEDERDQAILRLYEEKERERKAMTYVSDEDVEDDEDDDDDDEEEEEEDEDDGEKDGKTCQGCMIAGTEDSLDDHFRKWRTRLNPEYLAEVTRIIQLELKDNAAVPFGGMGGEKPVKVREFGKLLGHDTKHDLNEGGQVFEAKQLLGHETKHALSEGGQVFEAEQEHKKARMT